MDFFQKAYIKENNLQNTNLCTQYVYKEKLFLNKNKDISN